MTQPPPCLLQQSTQTVSANLRFSGRGPTGTNASAQTVLMVESGGGSLNVTKQIYYNHPNVTLTHIHIAYANVSHRLCGIFRGLRVSCRPHACACLKLQGGRGFMDLVVDGPGLGRPHRKGH